MVGCLSLCGIFPFFTLCSMEKSPLYVLVFLLECLANYLFLALAGPAGSLKGHADTY